jgi:hypothetical protein
MAGATSQEPCVHGYLSAQHKKTFTITVGILGAVFFIAQFIVAFIVMVTTMPSTMAPRLDVAHPGRKSRGLHPPGDRRCN